MLGIALLFLLVAPVLGQDADHSILEPGRAAAAAPDAALPAREGFSVEHLVRGILGILFLLALAWCMSFDRRRTPWKLVGYALLMQLAIGVCLIQWRLGYGVFVSVSEGISHLLGFAAKGAHFVFGEVAVSNANVPGLAFRALPTIIFFSCLMSVLYHLRVMHVVIWMLAQLMSRILGVTGAESMSMAANIFVGQTEAPLVIAKFIPRMTRSEIMSLMTGGFATVAGSVMAVYMGFLREAGGEEYAPHLLIGSVMAAPAAFAISKVILPETQEPETGKGMSMKFRPAADNVLDAAVSGVGDGLKLYLNVIAMLIAFTAMVALIDWPLGAIGENLGITGGLSLAGIFGRVLAPVAFLMGVEWNDAGRFGTLLGIKISLNEFLAYLELQREVGFRHDAVKLAEAGHGHALSPRTLYMATYALCGFANFASIGIQIGGISPLAPERRGEIIRFAFRAMLGGALATMMTATVAGMFF